MNKFKTLKDHVYDYIAEQILVGNLLPDEKINESSIIQELSISRTPVREALIQLSSEGILKNVPRKGFVLKCLDEKEASELYVVIGILDGLSAKLACNILSERDLKDMQFYIDSMDLAIHSKNYEMYLNQQKAFHQVYIDLCKNDALIENLEKMKNKFLRRSYNDDPNGITYNVLLATNEEHKKILKLFKERDSEGVMDYLANTHWAPANAHFDLMSLNK